MAAKGGDSFPDIGSGKRAGSEKREGGKKKKSSFHPRGSNRAWSRGREANYFYDHSDFFSFR